MSSSLLHASQAIYELPSSSAESLPKIKIPKATCQNQVSSNEEVEMRAWARMHLKSVRQRTFRQDNTMDRAGTLFLNLYGTETVLKPLDLNTVMNSGQMASTHFEPADKH